MPDDLEAFLRKAAEKRLARKRAAARKVAPPAPPASQPTGSSRPLVLQPTEPSSPPPPEGHESVSQHVARHIAPDQLAESAEELGKRVRDEEAHFESRLESVFDHQLGTLSSEATQATTIGERTTAEKAAARNFLTQLFENQTRIREAIILREILSTPPGLRDD